MIVKALLFVLAALVLAPAAFAGKPQADVRFSTFNASLNRSAAGQLVADLSTPTNQQARNVAETLQRVRPDVVLINEFDYDAAGTHCDCSRTTTCRSRRTVRRRSTTLPLRRRVEHRHPVWLRPE